MSLAPIVELYRSLLQPIAPFTWFGLGLSTLDIAGAFRLCLVLRQIREGLYKDHVKKHGEKANNIEQSLTKDLSTTLLVVYGGEALIAPYLGMPPSFMISGVVPALYTAVQALVEYLPAVPSPSLQTELPLSFFDGLTRAFLLCSLIPPTVTANLHPTLSVSPWSLLITSLITANAGFFFTNLFSFLHPIPLTLTTPPELRPYGWTTTDLWCAPLITGLYATLTHAQPFWADLHTVSAGWLCGLGELAVDGTVKPVDDETARAACAAVLAVMFATRAVKNFGAEKKDAPKLGKELKSQIQ